APGIQVTARPGVRNHPAHLLHLNRARQGPQRQNPAPVDVAGESPGLLLHDDHDVMPDAVVEGVMDPRGPGTLPEAGFPQSFLAEDDEESRRWRTNFVRTLLERDMPQLGVQIPAEVLRRFWTMVAHYHGQAWNGSEIGASLGVTHHTTRRYLDILTGAYVVRQLQPWFENLGKRLVRAPKVYVRDSGLLHSLLNIPDQPSLQAHPKLGASWEGFVIEQILSWTGERNAWFWGTHAGAELDLIISAKGKRWGFEIKYQDAPTLTKSMRIAMHDLKLERLWVLYPGKTGYPMDKHIECVPLARLDEIRSALE
ncbi:MAG: ATP-binding protein, partial [Verrucomicrobiota bacterium]